jgi:hypothetical protein
MELRLHDLWLMADKSNNEFLDINPPAIGPLGVPSWWCEVKKFVLVLWIRPRSMTIWMKHSG